MVNAGGSLAVLFPTVFQASGIQPKTTRHDHGESAAGHKEAVK
jgi:hypothetical protein